MLPVIPSVSTLGRQRYTSSIGTEPQVLGVSLTWRLTQNALPVKSIRFRMGVAEEPKSGRCSDSLKAAEHAFYHCPLWEHVGGLVTRIETENLLYLDVSYVCDNVSLSWDGLKRMVFLTLLAVTRMVV